MFMGCGQIGLVYVSGLLVVSLARKRIFGWLDVVNISVCLLFFG
jgi:hypothetical protein